MDDLPHTKVVRIMGDNEFDELNAPMCFACRVMWKRVPETGAEMFLFFLKGDECKTNVNPFSVLH